MIAAFILFSLHIFGLEYEDTGTDLGKGPVFSIENHHVDPFIDLDSPHSDKSAKKASIVKRSSIVEMNNGFPYQEIEYSELEKDNIMVVLAFGQSHSANYGESKYRCKQKVYFFYEDKFYLARDPLLVADGNMGSVWTRLGEKIIESGLYGSVLFIPIGIGASDINMWRYGGRFNKRMTESINSIQKYNLDITHVFWHQGSSDSWEHTEQKADEYRMGFLEIVRSIRSNGCESPIFICESTYSYGNSDVLIKKTQQSLVNEDKMIFPGPDSDDIGCRYDGVHFTDEGIDILSDRWFEKIVEYMKYFNILKIKIFGI